MASDYQMFGLRKVPQPVSLRIRVDHAVNPTRDTRVIDERVVGPRPIHTGQKLPGIGEQFLVFDVMLSEISRVKLETEGHAGSDGIAKPDIRRNSRC